MAYTRTWDETIPSGGSQISAGDDEIRAFKLDVRERLETFFVDIDADPLAPQPEKLLKTGQVLLLGPYDAQPLQDEDDAEWLDGYYLSDNTGNNSTRFNLPILKNWKITKVEAFFNLDGETSVTISLHKTEFAGPSETTTLIDSVTVGSVVLDMFEVFSGEETADGEHYYWLKFDGTDAGRYRIYGVRVTYDEVAA